jgi:hypothetical protein
VHRPDYTKQRLRLPLETKNVSLARSRRDTVLGAWSKEQRAWSKGQGDKSQAKQRTVRASSFNLPHVTSHSSPEAEAA